MRPGRAIESGAGRLWLAGTAVDALLDVRAECLQLGGPELLAILRGPGAVTVHFAGAGVTALLDLALDELLEMFPEEVARRHGWLPVAWLLGYQKLIVAASVFQSGPMPMAVKRSPFANFNL